MALKFSANLGFLWADRPLADAIKAAKSAGFDAVECHWPYDQPIDDVRDALEKTGLAMLGLNTRRGEPGENGMAALTGRAAQARDAIDEAIAYADGLNTGAIHVMCGFASGPEAHAQFIENLRYATSKTEKTILIEPLNRHDAPGYFLQTTDQACEIIAQLGAANLKLMFDCYHVARSEGDVATRLEDLLPHIGHIQFASVPGRGAPGQGELNLEYVFSVIEALGWERPLGAEYKTSGDTDATLDWMRVR